MIIATLNQPDQAALFLEAGADALLLPVAHLSVRQEPGLEPEALRETIRQLKTMGAIVCLNCLKILHNGDLDQARALLQLAKEEGADEIYVCDEGWFVLAAQAGLSEKLVYQPETLVTNGLDAQFYIDQNARAVCLAHELSLQEILVCAKDCASLEVLVHGYYSWMSSRRPLLSNYLREIHKEECIEDLQTHDFRIREVQREAWLPAQEREYGTTIWSGAPISSFAQMPVLLEAGIRRFRIDTSFLEPEMAARCIAAYKALEQNQEVPAEEIRMLQGDDSLYHTESVTRKENS